MSVEPNVATATFLGDTFTFVDCPGSVEFLHDMRSVVPACDAAVVVCEADEPKRFPAPRPSCCASWRIADIPRFLFINKIDAASPVACRRRWRCCSAPPARRCCSRQIPIWKDGFIAVGFIDLALERAFVYREHLPSEVMDLPDRGELPRARRRRASPCWSASPTTTTR